MNKLVALFTVVLMLPLSVFIELLPAPSWLLDPGTALAAGEYTVNVGDPAVTDAGRATPIEGVSITGTGIVPVQLRVTNGSLAMSTTTGLTFDGSQSGALLNFSGDIDDINAALATLTYTRGSAGSDTLEISLVEAGEVFFGDNGHLYEYISYTGTWQQAQAQAAAQERYGSTGYLATITSQAENDFAADRLEGAGWMGASDVSVEGEWRWVTGPESGEQFWQGAGDGSAFNGAYENWNEGEPNDSSGNEDCGQFLSGGSGLWNDLPCSGTTLSGYVVEFGAPGDLPATDGDTLSISTVVSPVISELSPADESEDIKKSSDLVLTFSKEVTIGTGNIYLFNDNDAVVRTIDVTSGSVTGSGTDTITIDPGSLPSGGPYYIRIDSTAFDATDGGNFAGILNDTTWNFTVERLLSNGVVLEVENVEITSTEELYCESNRVESTIKIEATGARNYMVSADKRFKNEAWKPFTGEQVELAWDYAIGESQLLYVMLNDRNGLLSMHEFELDTYDCSEVLPEAEEPVEEETPSEENFMFEEGMLIKSNNYDTVYLVKDGKRHPFVRRVIYDTWYSSFDDVVIVSDEELATLQMGTPVLPKEGTLVKIVSSPEVFVVETLMDKVYLNHIPNEASAELRYGANWAKQIIELDSHLFTYFAGKLADKLDRN